MSRIKKSPSKYEIIENGNDFKSIVPGLKDNNLIEAFYVEHAEVKSNKIFNLIFITYGTPPISFDVSSGVFIRLYQSITESTEDVIAKVLKVKQSDSAWLVEILVLSGDINKSTLNDRIVFNLELISSTKDDYEKPFNIYATNVLSSEATIIWTNPNSKSIESYALQYRKLKDSTNVNWTRVEFAKNETVILTPLETKTKYETQVMIIYKNGFSKFSDSYFFKTI